jgi:hypothetical protein
MENNPGVLRFYAKADARTVECESGGGEETAEVT